MRVFVARLVVASMEAESPAVFIDWLVSFGILSETLCRWILDELCRY